MRSIYFNIMNKFMNKLGTKEQLLSLFTKTIPVHVFLCESYFVKKMCVLKGTSFDLFSLLSLKPMIYANSLYYTTTAYFMFGWFEFALYNLFIDLLKSYMLVC